MQGTPSIPSPFSEVEARLGSPSAADDEAMLPSFAPVSTVLGAVVLGALVLPHSDALSSPLRPVANAEFSFRNFLTDDFGDTGGASNLRSVVLRLLAALPPDATEGSVAGLSVTSMAPRRTIGAIVKRSDRFQGKDISSSPNLRREKIAMVC